MSTPTRRADLFGRIHKAIRKSMFDTALAAGRANFNNPGDVAGLNSRLTEMISFLEGHAQVEDMLLLPALEAKLPGATAHTTEAHHGIEDTLVDLRAAFDTAVAAERSEAERVELGEAFYLALNNFVGMYLGHMHMEETVLAPVFWQHLTNEEIEEATARIASVIPMEKMKLAMRYMFAATNSAEHEEMFAMIEHAPDEIREIAMHAIESAEPV